MSKASPQKMCVINPTLVPLIAPLVGGQSDIMVRVGISWNSWNKILDGQPIRLSMAERFRARILDMASNLDSFALTYPAAHGGMDQAAVRADFFRPELVVAKGSVRARPMRSVAVQEQAIAAC